MYDMHGNQIGGGRASELAQNIKPKAEKVNEQSSPPPFSIEKTEYEVYNVIPDRFITEGKELEEILTTISALVPDKFVFKEGRLVYIPTHPIYYEVMYSGKTVSFNYTIPSKFSETLTNKIKGVYKTATVRKIPDYFDGFLGKKYAEYKQKEHFMFSLNVDYRANGFTENLITMVNNVAGNDKLLLQIGLVPLDDEWKTAWNVAYEKYKNGKTITVNNSLPLIALDKVLEFSESLMHVVDMFVGVAKEVEKQKPKNTADMDRRLYQSMTRKKITLDGFKLQIRLFCDNPDRAYYYGKLFSGVFKLLDGDQCIKFDGCKTFTGEKRTFDMQIYKNIYSTKEVSYFMQLPNRRMQIDFRKYVRSIDNREQVVPEQLRKGTIPIGESTYRGVTSTAYWWNDKNVLALPKVVVGGMGSGKTNYTKWFAYCANKQKDGLIWFDFIQNCEVTEQMYGKLTNCIKINMATDYNKFALAYPELQPESEDKMKRLDVAQTLSDQTENLINTLTTMSNTEPLSSQMSKYLTSACKIVYVHKGQKVADVINVLTNHVIRAKYVDMALASGCFEKEDNEILDMEILTDYDKDGIPKGTKDSKIERILDRISVLQKNVYLKSMMKAEINYDYDFSKWIDEGKTVLIQIPEDTFTTKQIKDTIVTYLMSRIWLAGLKRKQYSKVCHVMIDEVHQVPTCRNLLSGIVTEGRKFGIGFYFTAHFLKQFGVLLDAIKSASTSYMLLAGTEKENFNLLKEELAPFEVDELMEMEKFTSMNRISIKNEYVNFISKLPGEFK